MKACVFALLLLAPAAAGCSVDGSSEPASSTTTIAAPTTTVQQQMDLTVYRVDKGMLRPSVVRVDRTPAVAAAAIRALGITGTVTVAGGTATVDGELTADEVAEVVWTLTQFSSVKRVDVPGRTGLTRDDFASYMPPIAVDTPTSGASVSSPFHVGGTASVFEATLVVQVVRDGKVIEKQTVTASEGAPARGTFDTSVSVSPGPATIQAFAPSAADGSPQHEVDVDVTVTP